MIRIPNSSFQHQCYAVMLLIHKMSSQSQGILNAASNANADPVSKNWGFQHTPPSSHTARGVLVQPHTERSCAEATLPTELDPWMHFLQPLGCQGRREPPGCFYTNAHTQAGRVPIGLVKGNAQVSRFPGRKLQTVSP